MSIYFAIQLLMSLAVIIPAVLLWRQCSPRVKRISKRLIAVLAAGVLLAILTTTKLIHDEQSAREAAMETARDLIKHKCNSRADLHIVSIEKEYIQALAPNGRFFDVTVEARSAAGALGQIDVYVFDNIKILGFPIKNNELAGSSLRC